MNLKKAETSCKTCTIYVRSTCHKRIFIYNTSFVHMGLLLNLANPLLHSLGVDPTMITHI